MGNIHVALPPSEGVDGVPIFLNAHLDTVPPTGPIDPEVRNGVVVNRHDTILGADNKAAVVVMLAAVRDLVRTGRPHAGVELVLTPMEEVGLQGRQGLRHRASAARRWGTATTTLPRSETSSSPRRPSARCGFASSGGQRTPGSRPRRAEAPSSRPPARSPTCRSGGSTQRRPRTSASSTAASPATSSRPSAWSSPRPEAATRAGCASRCRRCSTRPRSPRIWPSASSRAGSSRSTTATGSRTPTRPCGWPPGRSRPAVASRSTSSRAAGPTPTSGTRAGSSA